MRVDRNIDDFEFTPERLDRARKAVGHTQEDVANEIGVTWASVHRWCTGKAVPRHAILNGTMGVKGYVRKIEMDHPELMQPDVE